MLTLSDAAHARLPAQPPLANGGCRRLRCFSAVGNYRRAHNLRVLIVDLFFLPVMLPSVLPKLSTDYSEKVSWCLETSLFLRLLSWDGTPFPGQNSVPPSFVSFFVFYIFSYLLSKSWAAFLGA